jgi:ribonuclease BN (tRNA processing enzyme)
MTQAAQLVFLGARGSIPISGRDYVKYGGNTTCLAICEDDEMVGVIDAGTGLVRLDDHGLDVPTSLAILLTHYHWDHIQGLSMLPELWNGGHMFTFIGAGDIEAMLTGAIRPPWFPIALRESECALAYRNVDERMRLGDVAVGSFPVNHPQGAVGFRLDGPRGSIALVTDHESTSECDDIIAPQIEGVDVLIHDAQYLPAELARRHGWGHSTWEQAVVMAERIGATRLILTSHSPRRTDPEIDAIVSEARARVPDTEAAREGLRVDF